MISEETLSNFIWNILPKLTACVFIIFTAYILAEGTWMFLSPKQKTVYFNNIADNKESVTKHSDISEIKNLYLFGKQDIKPIRQEIERESLSNFNLQLTGVFAAKNKDNSLAIIMDSNKNEKLYAINDKLAGNFILSEIYDDHVVLLQNNRQAVLYLKQEEK